MFLQTHKYVPVARSRCQRIGPHVSTFQIGGASMQLAAESSQVQLDNRLQLSNRTYVTAPSIREAYEVVYLVENEVATRSELIRLLNSQGLATLGFDSAQECLRRPKDTKAACVIVDFHTPDLHGADFIRQLKNQTGPPVICIGDSPGVPDVVSAMQAGAVEFFRKPINPDALMEAIRRSFTYHRRITKRANEFNLLKDRLLLLTPRERQVLPLVVGGMLNKQAAALLGISEVTLQIHRSQVMRKMGAASLADLVRMAVKLRIPYRSVELS